MKGSRPASVPLVNVLVASASPRWVRLPREGLAIPGRRRRNAAGQVGEDILYLSPIDVHWLWLKLDAIRKAVGREAFDFTLLYRATWEDVCGQFRLRRHNVLYLVTHGVHDPGTGRTWVIFEDGRATGGGSLVNDLQFKVELVRGPPIRLIVLSACGSATPGARFDEAGFRARLTESIADLPHVAAVVGM